jgi:ribose-phosphate pyrophosphokinase
MEKPKGFALPSYRDIANNTFAKMGDCIENCYNDLTVSTFSDNEKAVAFESSVRNREIYIYGSTTPDLLMEMCLAVDAAKRSGASKVNLIVPYFGYARQDKKSLHRGGIGGKLVANLLTTSGADSILAFDLHSDAIEGFFDISVVHISGHLVFKTYLEQLIANDETGGFVICSPDNGGTARATKYAESLNLPMVVFDKKRIMANHVSSMTLIGDVKNKNVILVDDIGDTLGTLSLGVDKLIEAGAKNVYACLTHAVLSGKAYERLDNMKLTKLFVTDTIVPKQSHPKIEVVRINNVLSDTLTRIIQKEPINGK